jgi:ribosome biogenesis GTPase
MPEQGRLVSRFGAEMLVEDDSGNIHRCTGRKKVADAVCGDNVTWEHTKQGNDIVTTILPRKNLLKRPVSYGREKNIAANVDQILIVLSYGMKSNWSMLDHYLVATHSLHAQPIILCNKLDLAEQEDESRDKILNEYTQLGYRVIRCSCSTEQGLSGLKQQLTDKTNILVGQSGVGKSSIVKALHPTLDIRIGELSDTSGEGQHTTSVATLYHLPDGGELIDSPGVRDFKPESLDRVQIEQGFPEFQISLGACRFHNCTHTKEPGCHIKERLEKGEILPRRYESYLRLISEQE